MPGAPLDLDASIQTLEGSDWGEARFGTALVRAGHALRRKKLRELTDDDIRLGLGQQIGLRYLVPLALQRLRQDVFIRTHYFDGDMLANVLNIPGDFWDAHKDWQAEAEELAQRYIAGHASHPEGTEQGLKSVREAHARFTGEMPPRRWLRAKGDIPEE